MAEAAGTGRQPNSHKVWLGLGAVVLAALAFLLGRAGSHSPAAPGVAVAGAQAAGESADQAWWDLWKEARALRDGRDGQAPQPAAAIALLTRIADAKVRASGIAVADLAELHYLGFGTREDPVAAAELLRTMINSGRAEWIAHVEPLYGWFQFHGIAGVPKDEAAAVTAWSRLHNDPVHRVHTGGINYVSDGLGLAHAFGRGVPKDLARAEAFFTENLARHQSAVYRRLRAEGVFAGGCPEDPRWFDRKLDQSRFKRFHAEAEAARATCLVKVAAGQKKPDPQLVDEARDSIRFAESLGHLDVGKHKVALAKGGGVSIGMSRQEVLASKWGKPESVNRTVTATGVTEQWVYGSGNYLYFRDGVLTTIQN